MWPRANVFKGICETSSNYATTKNHSIVLSKRNIRLVYLISSANRMKLHLVIKPGGRSLYSYVYTYVSDSVSVRFVCRCVCVWKLACVCLCLLSLDGLYQIFDRHLNGCRCLWWYRNANANPIQWTMDIVHCFHHIRIPFKTLLYI